MFWRKHSEKIEIRVAQPDELTGLVWMVEGAFREKGIKPEVGAARAIQEHLISTLSGEQSTILVAVLGDTPIGMVCAGIGAPELWDGKPSAHVWFLFVREEYRRTAAAERLTGGCLKLLEIWGVSRCRFSVEKAGLVRYYARKGYRIEGLSIFVLKEE